MMQERDKEFAKAVDEIVKGIDENFPRIFSKSKSPSKPRKTLTRMVINLLNISK
ncbi:hypothetical protein [Thermosyntropha sp.]|uniref:hypothetical protein n=1 Tax=Thermosyntropha sp. TaxID=2740820 RepID=UPI0025E71FB1|nr:hypothetical protein [Thermosyntropha sp.]MBO8158919.1 hypothetical protein [Thermosyntropha sp.]